MSSFSLRLRHVLGAAVLFSLSLPVVAQCGLDWQPGAPAAGVKGLVWAALSASNGDLIVGGQFVVADASVTNRIARWNGTTWSPLGAGIDDGTVSALAQLQNGDLIAGGQFTGAGGQPAGGLARWNGSAWSQLGALGASGGASALIVMPNGDLIVAGSFTAVSGVAANNIARWDGSSWSALGTGLPSGAIHALALEPSGDLIAGGVVPSVGGMPANGLARWDGSSWSAIVVPTLSANVSVQSLARLPNGDLAFATNHAAGNLGLWNGLQLQWLTPPVSQILALAVAPSGHLVAGGFHGLAPTDPSVAIFVGGAWIDVSAGAPRIVHVLWFDGTGALVAAGSTPGGPGVFRSTGPAFVPLGIAEVPPRVAAVQRLLNGHVVIGGQFDSIGGSQLANLARWNGSAYVPLGLGVNGPVRALAIAGNGDLLVGGDFTTAGGAPAPRIARWNGTSWSTLGGGLTAAPTMLAANPGGEVLAVVGTPGSQSLLRFDGLVWSPLSHGFTGTISAVGNDPNGDIVLGGMFLGGTVATGSLRYASGGFQPLTSGAFSLIRGFARSADGELVGLGTFPGLGSGAARLVGGAWSAIGASTGSGAWTLRHGTFLPNGDLVVAGIASSVQGQPANGLLRFDGSVWTALPGLAGASVVGLAASDAGELFAAGTFEIAGAHVSVGVARAEPTCPAGVVSLGAGCTGAAGPVSLAADSLPWAGATFRATAQGIPASSLALHAVGVQPTLLPLPLGAPGCFLYVDPIDLSLLAPAGGAASVAFTVPDSPSLAGLLVRSQVAVVELGAGFTIVRLTSTPPLELTIGAL